ncbi:MAG TPA: phosphatase PAP2 family protein [Polyangiales bacterium]|nr:phosphatase PAP2 family protein [Polyangiales bacterium]
MNGPSKQAVSPARESEASSFAPARARGLLATFARNLALQDYAILGLSGFLAGKALFQVHGDEAPFVRSETLALFGVAFITLFVTRGELIGKGQLRSVLYRVGSLGSMIGSYLGLRPLLHALHPVLVDQRLLAIDQVLFFGKTPSSWLDRFVTPASVEWFAFFYFSYYALLGGYLFGTLLFDEGRRRYEMMLGAGLVAAIGHAGYTFVPGIGPYACPGLTFQHALVGGVWWGRVEAAVTSAGAMLDIFPSLHTGFSLLTGLHAFRYRHESPLNWVWRPTLFFVANIIVATVFLRWHYGIDLIAGAALACGSYRLACYAWKWEAARGIEDDRQPVWEPVLPLDMDRYDRRWLMVITLMQVVALTLLLIG